MEQLLTAATSCREYPVALLHSLDHAGYPPRMGLDLCEAGLMHTRVFEYDGASYRRVAEEVARYVSALTHQSKATDALLRYKDLQFDVSSNCLRVDGDSDGPFYLPQKKP